MPYTSELLHVRPETAQQESLAPHRLHSQRGVNAKMIDEGEVELATAVEA